MADLLLFSRVASAQCHLQAGMTKSEGHVHKCVLSLTLALFLKCKCLPRQTRIQTILTAVC